MRGVQAFEEAAVDTASTSQRPVNALEVIDLEVGGMTCASCAARIEKKLNKLDGVEASVNYATEKANVRVPEGVSADDLIAVVEKTGYTAKLPAPRTPAPPVSGGGAGGASAIAVVFFRPTRVSPWDVQHCLYGPQRNMWHPEKKTRRWETVRPGLWGTSSFGDAQ